MFSGPQKRHSSLCVLTFRPVPFSPLFNRFVPLFSKIKISIHVLHVPENRFLDLFSPEINILFPHVTKNPWEGLISLSTFSANSQSDLDRSKFDMRQKYIERMWWIKGWIRESICSHRHLERCHHVALQIWYIFNLFRSIRPKCKSFHFISSFDLIFPISILR